MIHFAAKACLAAFGTSLAVPALAVDTVTSVDQASALGYTFVLTGANGGNRSSIVQQGSYNRAEANQSGNGNVAILTQNGSNNTALISQLGSSLIQSYQNGSGAAYSMQQSTNAGPVIITQHR